jgi:hypothetical protein
MVAKHDKPCTQQVQFLASYSCCIMIVVVYNMHKASKLGQQLLTQFNSLGRLSLYLLKQQI